MFSHSKLSEKPSMEMSTWKVVKVFTGESAQQASEEGWQTLLLKILQPDCDLKITTVFQSGELTE